MKTAKEKIIEAANENIKHIIDLCAEIGESLRSDNENEIKLAAGLAKVTIDFLQNEAPKMVLKLVTHTEYQH